MTRISFTGSCIVERRQKLVIYTNSRPVPTKRLTGTLGIR